jgi:hypothetical protein
MTENKKPLPEKDLANVLADLVVNDYIEHNVRQAMLQVEKERCGKGCGCIRCATAAVNEVNDWVGWVAAGNPKMEEYLDAIKYRIVKKRKGRQGWRIIQGRLDES